MMRMTTEQEAIKKKIESLITQKGGYTRTTLQSLGVPWPPPKGWKSNIIKNNGTYIHPSMKPLNEIASDWAKKGAAESKGAHGRMCDQCAFKKDSDANLEEHNVGKALTCLTGEGQFNCHDHDATGKLIDAGRPCAGFLYAKHHVTQIENAALEKGILF